MQIILICTIAAMVGGASFAAGDDEKKEGTRITVKDTTLTFDPKTVMRGYAGFGWGLGSSGVNVLGREKDACIFDYHEEVEGGFAVYRCRVPLDQTVKVYQENGGIVTSFPLEKAKRVRVSNILLPRNGEPAHGLQIQWTQRGVHKTNFVNYQADVIVGTGAVAVQGKSVTIRCRIFADDIFCTEYVGVESRHELKFKIGEGDLGPGLAVAVTDMKERGRRFVLMREEVAGHFVKQLGGLQPGSRIGVEIELVNVE